MNRNTRVIASCTLIAAASVVHDGVSAGALAATLLSVLVLAAAAASVPVRGMRLALMLFLVYGGVRGVNTVVEAAFFSVISLSDAFRVGAGNLLYALIISSLVAVAVPGRDSEDARRTETGVGGLIWRLPAGAFCYVVIYVIAGMAAFPFVEEFYAGKRLPTLPELFGVQAARGLFYIGTVWLFIPYMAGRAVRAGWTFGLSFAVFGGIVPLLLASDYMPGNVRLVHAVEVGIANFVFGVVLAQLLVPRNRPERLQAAVC